MKTRLNQAEAWFWGLILLSCVCLALGLLTHKSGTLLDFHIFDFLGTCATLVVGYAIAVYAQRTATSSSRLYDLVLQKIAVAESAIISANRSSLDYLNRKTPELRQIMQSDLKRVSMAVQEMLGVTEHHHMDDLSNDVATMKLTVNKLRELLDVDITMEDAVSLDSITQVNSAYNWLISELSQINGKCINI